MDVVGKEDDEVPFTQPQEGRLALIVRLDLLPHRRGCPSGRRIGARSLELPSRR